MKHKLILVDDCTTDKSREYHSQVHTQLSDASQQIQLFTTDGSQHGISKTWNKAIRAANLNGLGQDYIIILNNDIFFPPLLEDKCWLERMVELGDANPEYGWISPQWHFTGKPKEGGKETFKASVHDFTRNNAGKIDGGGLGCFYMLRMEAVIDMMKKEEAAGTEPNPGLFDEINYKCQWEDLDYILRLKRAGWKVGVFNDVALCHHGSGTIETFHGKLAPQYRAGQANFYKKWGVPSHGEWRVSNAQLMFKKGGQWVVFE